MQLRDYQKRSLDDLYKWMRNNDGNVVISLPTGSGKSVVIAELCKQAVQGWPDTKILMLTRSMELINQNAQKLQIVWPDAPMGIYSASIGKKQLGDPITIGGPLSIVRVLDKIGHCDLLICDECHDISHKDEGSYRKIIDSLMKTNPAMRVIGFTGSPFRLGHGLITDKPAIFDDIIEPVSVKELILKSYLAVLKSKSTSFKLSTEGVHKRGGEFIDSELQKIVDTDENNLNLVKEVIARSEGRKSWMFFCTGVAHSQKIRDLLIKFGVSAVSVTGDMPKAAREKAIDDFKAGRITAITQVNCLSTGFDHAAIDMLVLARPTMSPGLYLQQVGRGMRPSPEKSDCLVLDFAGVVAMHGPITNVQPPKKGGSGNGEAPIKVCDMCHEIVHISAKVCPNCNTPFPIKEKSAMTLRQDDIMGIEGVTMKLTSWKWRSHISKASGNTMLKVTYYGGLSDPAITEYLPILNQGYAGIKAIQLMHDIANYAKANLSGVLTQTSDNVIDVLCVSLNNSTPPKTLEFKRDGKFYKVLSRSW